jgi:signal transduction histidine kinase
MEPNAIAQWAHDIRNTLGTVALYLESLERPCYGDAIDILARSDALLKKATSMCSDLMREAAQDGAEVRQQSFDVTQTVDEVLGLVAPIVPAATTLVLASNATVHVFANPKDVFRILFNLIHNAVGAARTAGTTRRIELALEQRGQTVIIKVADDGPGLPEHVRARLFQRDRLRSDSHGYGLSIARELAERNGASLELSDATCGTQFTIELPAADSEPAPRPGATQAQSAMSDAI